MFIDCHIHVIEEPTCPRPQSGKQPLDTPDNVVALYDSLGIEKGVILPQASPENGYFLQSHEELLRIVRRHPDRFIPFCNLDPRACFNNPDAPLEYVLKYYRDQGCKGVGEVVANLQLDDPRVDNLFRAVEATGMALTFHLAPQEGGFYGLVEEQPGLKKLERALQKFPNLKFFGHSQVFWGEMGEIAEEKERRNYPKGKIEKEGATVRLLRKYPNLYGDLSAGSGCNALTRDEDYAVKFLNEFQDKLMFGTDYCAPGTPTPLVDFLLRLRTEKKISETVFRKVARENIIRILDL